MLRREAVERGLHAEIRALGDWLAARPRFAGGLLVLLVVYALLVNAWVDEDAYITLRSVEQVMAGNGPRWNPHERVQAYTHPLWFWLLVGVRLLVPDGFFAAILLGLVCSSLAIGLLYREIASRRGPPVALVAVLTFLSSKAVMDYTTSGLENSLSYLLLIAALALAWRAVEAPAPRSGLVLVALLCVSLLASNRLDSLALTLPLVVVLVHQHAGRRGALPTAGLVLAGTVPLLACVAFSLYYYGFPVPNTVYAKVFDEVGLAVTFRRGLQSALVSALLDPLLAVVVVAGVRVARTSSSTLWRAVAVGILLDVAAVIAIGGDYMAGRFFTLALVAALFVLGQRVAQVGASRWLLALLLYAFFPFHPLHPFADHYDAKPFLGVTDERAFYAPHSSLDVCVRGWVTGDGCPQHQWANWGRAFARSRERVSSVRNTGFYGYAAGLDQIVVDELALSDALLARMPLAPGGDERTAHGARVVPEGYLESLEAGENWIRDPSLRAYYEKLRILTSAPLRSPGRLRTVLLFNLGRYDDLLDPHPAADRRPD